MVNRRNINILIFAICNIFIYTVSGTVLCDLAGYFHRSHSWRDQGQHYTLPRIPDFTYIGNDTIRHSPLYERDVQIILGTTKIFKFGWRILNPTECIAIVASTRTEYYLTLPHDYVTAKSGECDMAIEYPLGYEQFVLLWRRYIKGDSRDTTITLPLYTCTNDLQWRNNKIHYDFSASTRPSSIKIVQSAMSSPNWIDCERIVNNNRGDYSLLNEEDIANIIVSGTKAIDQESGREYDTVAVSIKKGKSDIISKGLANSLVQSEAEKKMLRTTCTHANYNISVELAVLSPETIFQSDVDSTDNETDILIRNKWVTVTVRDNKAPIIYDIPTQPGFIPMQTECLWDALQYATHKVPIEYNKNVKVSDNCALTLPPPVYTWKFVNLEENGVVSPDQTCDHRGSLVMSWTSTDGCGNDAVVQQVIRVFDNKPASLISSDFITTSGVIKGCITKLPNDRILCLDKIIDSVMPSVVSDNCDETTSLSFKGLWDTKKVQRCKSAQKPNSLKAYLSCVSVPLNEVKTNVRSCIILQEHWLKINFDVEVSDTCRNKMTTEIELLVSPTETICNSFGYLLQ